MIPHAETERAGEALAARAKGSIAADRVRLSVIEGPEKLELGKRPRTNPFQKDKGERKDQLLK